MKLSTSDNQDENNDSTTNEVELSENGFIYQGVEISNPTLSSCGRFVVDPIKTYGFSVASTGGNCTALHLSVKGGGYIWLTDGNDSHELPTSIGESFLMGVFDENDIQIRSYDLKVGEVGIVMSDDIIEMNFDNVIEDAEQAFWGVIANSYPDIKTGDLPPEVVINLELMMKEAVAVWLKGNAESHEIVTKLVPKRYQSPNDDVDEEDGDKSQFLSRSEIEETKAKYPVGTRIRVDSVRSESTPIEIGTYGAVESVDDIGQLHIKWDNNRLPLFALVPNRDIFTVLTVSLEEFVATKVQSNNIEEDLNYDNGKTGTKGYIYMGTYYIELLENGSYSLPICLEVFDSEDITELEKILYDMHFNL